MQYHKLKIIIIIIFYDRGKSISCYGRCRRYGTKITVCSNELKSVICHFNSPELIDGNLRLRRNINNGVPSTHTYTLDRLSLIFGDTKLGGRVS